MVSLNKHDVDLEKLLEHLKSNLPVYARPLFVRLCKQFDYTGEFWLIYNYNQMLLNI